MNEPNPLLTLTPLKPKPSLTILIGISGSGKSTYAHKQWLEDPVNTLIVNRDKIRELLFGYTESNIDEYYSKTSDKMNLTALEKEVTRYESLIIKEGLSMNKRVIVDSTHLRRQYLERYRFYNVATDLLFFPCTADEAFENQRGLTWRTRQVRIDVIENQYQAYVKLTKDLEANPPTFPIQTITQNPSLPNCVIFDIDGTLAHNNGHRSPFDWGKVEGDIVDESVRSLYNDFACAKEGWGSGATNYIICSGRDEISRELTMKWLKDNKFYNLEEMAEMHMRKPGDFRPDWIVKEEMWIDISTRYNILYLVDDRCQVVDRARSLGLKVLQAEYSNF